MRRYVCVLHMLLQWHACVDRFEQNLVYEPENGKLDFGSLGHQLLPDVCDVCIDFLKHGLLSLSGYYAFPIDELYLPLILLIILVLLYLTDNLYIAMEFMNDGDLKDLIDARIKLKQ